MSYQIGDDDMDGPHDEPINWEHVIFDIEGRTHWFGGFILAFVVMFLSVLFWWCAVSTIGGWIT